MEIHEIREEAAKLLERTNWTQRAAGRDAQGRETNPFSENAVCFCLVGAIARVSHDALLAGRKVPDSLIICREISREYGFMSIVQFNDTEGRTKEQVLNVLRGK